MRWSHPNASMPNFQLLRFASVPEPLREELEAAVRDCPSCTPSIE